MKDRSCRKCGEYIPWRLKIGEVVKFIPNRKYCLKCSPWGRHNTKVNIDKPARASLIYKDWPDEWKKKAQYGNTKRSKARKEELVRLAGGKCIKCGYSKCSGALVFHHLRDKKFGLCVSDLANRSWEEILEEFSKCELKCMNCHAEDHYEANR